MAQEHSRCDSGTRTTIQIVDKSSSSVNSNTSGILEAPCIRRELRSTSSLPLPVTTRNVKDKLAFGGPQVDPDLDNNHDSQRLSFLDKLRSSPRYYPGKKQHDSGSGCGTRSGNKSRSLLSSPNKPSGIPPPSTSPSGQSDIFVNFGSSISSIRDGDDNLSRSNSKGNKKWYSFTNLLSKSSFRSWIISRPRSRLSVSSIFTSESDVTPTELPDFGFPGCTHHQIVPASPSPSCVTVSGEFPSRSGSFPSSVNYRRPRYTCTGRSYSVNASPGGAGNVVVGPTQVIPKASPAPEVQFQLQSEREPSYKQRHRAHRVSCGDFYPGSPSGSTIIASSSPGFLGLDFQFHCYNRGAGGVGKCCQESTGTTSQNKRPLGRSLPTLLEAMESSKPDGSFVPDPTDGPTPCPITVDSVSELLSQEYIILTGSKTLDDHYLLIFPDRGNFHQLTDDEYKRLVKYLLSIPPMQDAEAGFVLIIDRRNDKWNSVKTTLLRISAYFPGLVHRVFVLRPLSFLQKAISEVSSKVFRNENVRFRLTVCNQMTDLLGFADVSQLPVELGGTLDFDKVQWVRERVEVESFHAALQNLSRDLKSFTESFPDMEFPNDSTETHCLIVHRTTEFNILHSDLLKATEHGEKILRRIKNIDNNSTSPTTTSSGATASLPIPKSSVQLVNVIILQRYILQIEETTTVFQEFWDKERLKLERYLELRRFEQDFRELQTSFDFNVKSLNGIPEMGESVSETEELILETLKYQDVTKGDLNKALNLEGIGRNIVSTNSAAVDIVEPKCLELSRMASHFRFILQEKITRQKQWREVQQTIEKANDLCQETVDMLNSQQITESLDESPDLLLMKLSIEEIATKLQSQLDDLTALKTTLGIIVNPPAKTLVKQILRRVEQVQDLVFKRQTIVQSQLDKKGFSKSRRPSGGTFFDTRSSRAFSDDVSDGSSFSSLTKTSLSSTTSSDGGGSVNGKWTRDDCAEKELKRGHVLQELIQTEETYVEEIGLILSGYRDQVTNSDSQAFLPSLLTSKHNVSVLFCNLDEIYAFHSKIFLPDLKPNLGEIELVALCFIQRYSDFLAMYSEYCQLKAASDTLLKEIGEGHPWLLWCQEKLGHRLSLGSYLLKPVQRITKYHLLLGNLVKASQECEGYGELLEAVDCMVELVRSVNDAMHQLQIRGYPAKLSTEGPLLLQGQFSVWIDNAKNRLSIKCHQRYLFLYQKSILVCKKTGHQSSLQYEFKTRINLSEVGITEDPKGGSGGAKKFEIWIQGRQEVYLFQAPTKELKGIWVHEIKKLLMEQLQYLRESKGSTTPTPNTPVAVTSSSNGKKTPRFAKVQTLNGYWSQPSHLPVRQTPCNEHFTFTPESSARPKSCTDLEDDLYLPN